MIRPLIKLIISVVLSFSLMSQMSLATSESDYVYQMERIFKDHLTQIQAPGFSVAVIKNGKVILAKGYGKKVINQNQPMDENTILSIGSLTKSFTAMAILQLQEKGALNIDDPVVKYLPWFRSSDKALSDTITLRMMLNNASGLSPRFSILSNNTSRRPDALEKGVRAMSSYEIKRKPGESFEYLNEGWNTLGLIIEKISGLTWEEYIEQNILQPLNMSKSSAERKVIEQWDVAKGHYSGITPVAADLIHIQGSLPAGSGFFSNVIDLSHYLTALVKGGKFNGQTLLNEKSLKDLWKPTVAVTGLSKEMGGDGKPAHYAMGWFVFDIDGERYISHGGEARTSSSQAMIDPIHNSAVVILYNTGNLESYSNESNLYVSHNILRILKDMPLSQFAIPVEADPLLNYFLPAKDNLDHYHGVYLSGSGKRMRIQAGGSEGLQMFLQDTIYPSDLDVDFINDTSFVMRNIAQRIQGHFTYNEDGTVASLVWGGETFSKKQNRDNQKYTSYQSDKEDISFALPPRWNVVWDDTVFNASVSGASDLQLTGQIVSLEFEDWLAQAGLPNDTEEISELRNGYIYQGAIVTDDQAEKKRIFLYCRTQNQKYGFILTVPEGQLTHEIIQTLNPFLDSLDLY